MNSCECSPDAATKTQAMMDNMKAYADAGGRMFLSHYHSIWIEGEAGVPTHAPAVWPGIATCQAEGTGASSGVIDQVNNPKGAAFAAWMVNVMGSTTLGTLPISEGRQSCTAVDLTKAERWVYYKSGSMDVPQNFQFLTPNEVPKDERCGKVVFSDMHVSSGSVSGAGTTGTAFAYPFPDGCSLGELTPQEKALAFIFFDISSCVGTIF